MVSIKLAREKLVFNIRSVPCLPPHTASQALDLTGWQGVLQDLQGQRDQQHCLLFGCR